MSTSRKKIWLAAMTACAVGGVAFASSGTIARQLNDWDMLPKPEPYTLLYFNEPAQLPAIAGADSEQYISATVRNMQHEPTTYRYTISAVPFGGGPHIIKQGECAAKHNTDCTINERFALPALAPRMQVRIDLSYMGRSHDQPSKTEQKQSLHYWVDVTPPGSNP